MDTQPTSHPPQEPVSAPAPAPKPPAAAKNSFGIPIAIIVGFALIAGAIYFSGGGTLTGSNPGTNQNAAAGQAVDTMLPITEDDHIRGNPNAPIMFVEYSDYDCPFCKDFHETMTQIINEYGLTGKVAWVYRHFPLPQLHPNAPLIAHAAECVAELGGNDAFWTFSDLVFGERGSNEQTNISRLSEFAKEAGVDEAAFTACNESGRHQQAIADDFASARAVDGKGTPHTVVIVGDQQAIITGAQPYQQIKQAIENLLAQMEGVPQTN